ncbi:glycosyl hydrolase family 61-domain-containing protein [Thelonectria olida]|uniref:lytic cellulose monooxygenase (C4-dehydrogenating) n=1 Tax=Thelonectria olida TaxID=1576542 RepID=A0A9P9AL81_9HYPO|nr:glycosyl hydrolase family 61-domain-containing protein [Thelonectria olida]
MRASFSSILAVVATLPVATFAHYNFEALIVNGNITDPYEYVRQTTNSNSPIADVTSDDMICNQGGLDADIRAKTKTHTVAPGDEVGFSVNVEIGHPGPLAVYLSKAPDGTETSDYLGGGDWFKVYELSTSSITDAGLQWATYVNNAGIHNFTFALPDNLPSGNYLMRAEHIGLHAAGSAGGAQFYIGCAQLAVEGSGSGSPSPTVQIPGYLTGEEPGVLINIYYPAPTSYTAPGPDTWPNACEDHTANFAGQSSDGDCTGSDSDSDSGSDSSSGSSSSAAASTPSATVISTPSSTAADNGVVTTSIAPAATSAASADEPTSVQSEAPLSTPTKTPSNSCSAKRKSRKAKRAAKRAAEQAQKRALEELMRRAIYE